MPIITLILRIPTILALLAKVVGIFSTKRMALRDLQLRLLISELHYVRALCQGKALIQSQYGCRRAEITKEGKAFVAEHAGKIILNATDTPCLDQMMLSLREHPVSSALVNGELAGKSEQSFLLQSLRRGSKLSAVLTSERRQLDH